ncbi:MAG: hypothetical protein EBE86_024840 [Hormoscilla sp. GUM202]|nr:hypothetical protein [Hormoscilla sp. GUM202]
MKEPTELQKQQYARLQELTAIARKRYLDTGGDPKRCPSGRKGDDYMTDSERRESLELTRILFGVRIKGDRVHCQGRSWQLSANYTWQRTPIET